jgi:WD40 repeat protein/energy-coupling factor transporter ATP-binding protein EcfA2
MQGGRVVRVFISSPGDVERERRAAAAVVRRLDREFHRFFAVEPYLWEQEPQLASGHFQDYIKPPAEFDVVVLILWSRLGTHLPERTRVREYRGSDGRAPVTGTEWEYEHARSRAEETGAPALLVFRNQAPAPVSTSDLTLQALQLDQLKALNEFWARHFHDRGVFLTAFTNYVRLEEFEDKLANQLRQVLENLRRRGLSDAPEPAISWLGSPFRGLDAYEFQHAPIFYGRDAAVRQAIEQLAANAAEGTAFLLILGASGSGKSSLVRAGLLPELSVPRAVSGVGAWRRVIFRPSASPHDLFEGLARDIARSDREHPDVGLPEIVSDYFPVKLFARHLRDNPSSPGAPFQLALGQIGAALAQSEALLRGEQVRLVVVVDQLEELFTDPAITPAEGERFVLLLSGLARSGVVWVVATMRSDFWHRVAEMPLLGELASGRGRLDLWPPSAAELTEIIRRPAAAAGLRFEEDEHLCMALDAQIAADAASAPGVLPLLSYTLETLYARDVEKAGGNSLTWQTYRALGGLHGAIARRADDMVAELGRDGVDDQVVARVLRRLVSPDESEGGRIVARTAPLAAFALGSPERRLVDAFLRSDMRLLVAEGDFAEARLRIAHEALLTGWARAQRLLAEDATNLARRRRLEEAERRWREAIPEDRFGLLLRPGLELNEAEALLAAWAKELDPALRAYLAQSRDAERRRTDEREETARQLADRLAEAQLNQSRFLTSIAEAELRDGHIERAMLIAREALPRDMRKPDRPIWNGAFAPIAKAREQDRAIAVAVGHQDCVWTAAFSPDGARIVTASGDHTARLWDGKTGAVLAILEGHQSAVLSAMASPDGTRIVTASSDHTARLWDGKTGTVFTTLRGHRSAILSAMFSPDGARIVTASEDHTARVWDGKTGAPLATLAGHKGTVECAAFSSDGALIVTGSDDGTARLWDGTTGTVLTTLEGHQGKVWHAAFSPDGARIVTTSNDHTARLWDGKTATVLNTLEGHQGTVWRAAFSPDGARIVTGSDDHTARLWDGKTGSLLATLRHRYGVNSAVFSQDGTRVVTASRDGTARLWDGNTGAPLAILEGHHGEVQAAVFGPDGARVVTASRDGTARLWDGKFGAVLASLEGHQNWVWSAAFSPDGKRVVTSSSDHTARLWDGKTGAVLAVLEGHQGGVWSAAFSPDGTRIVTACHDHVARAWDARTGSLVATFEGHQGPVRSAAFSPDGARIVTASEDRTARLWDGKTGALLATLESYPVGRAAFSPDGARIVTASWDTTARVWDSETGALLATLVGHREGVNSAAFCPDGACIVTASGDHTARLWDGKTGAVLAALEGHQAGVASAAFSPDGARIVTASEDGTARLWDGKTGAALATLSGHQNPVRSAVFSPDGRIVTASDDHTARLWDGQTGALLATLEGHQGWVQSALFSPDGARVVTASQDNTARLWPVWPLLRDDSAAYVAIAAMRTLFAGERSHAFLTAAAVGTAEATPAPDRHRQLAEGFERAAGAGRDLEQALFHYAIAVRLFEEQGREDEARLARMRRGSLARVLPPQTAVRIAHEAIDWRPTPQR